MIIKNKKYLIIGIILFAVISLTVGFSTLSNTLSLSDIVAKFRLPAEVRVTNFFVTSSENGGQSTYDEYNVNTISAGINLPNQNSTVTYRMEVTNLSNAIAQIESITGLPSNLEYELSDYTIGDDLCDTNDRCRNGAVKDFLITFKYTTNGYNSSQTEYLLNLNVTFTTKYLVEYIGNMFYTQPRTENGITIDYDPSTSILTLDGTVSPYFPYLMFLENLSFNEGDKYNFSIEHVSGSFSQTGTHAVALDVRKNNFEVLGTFEENGVTHDVRNFIDLYFKNDGISTGTLVIDETSANIGSSLYIWVWLSENNTITFNNYKAKVKLYKEEITRLTYGSNYVLPSSNPIRNGFTFNGWHTEENGGTQITSSDTLDVESDKTFYAHWTDTDVIGAPTISFESNYETNGLQVLLDGRNNTGNGHNSSSSTWKNLAGNNSATINGPVWNGDALSFDGVDDEVIIGEYNNDYYSLEITFSTDELLSGVTEEFLDNFQSGGIGLQMIDGMPRGILWVDSSSNTVTEAPDAIQEDTKYTLSLTYDGTIGKLYINGKLVSSVEITGTIIPANNNTVFAVGCNPNGSSCDKEYFKGNIYSVRIYNRALTEEQILNNYNVDNLYKGEYSKANFKVNVTGGSSNLGIIGYKYAINSSTYSDYVSSNKPSITDEGEVSVKAKAMNINHTLGSTRTDTVYIDDSAPTINLSVTQSGFNLTATPNAVDTLSGIKSYYYKISDVDTCDSTVTGFTSSTETSYVFNPVAIINYVCVKVEDMVGNVSYAVKQAPGYYFNYTGDVQTFTVPTTGYYYIETWGAQGGEIVSSQPAAKGGYSAGYIYLNQGDNLYVYVGGQGGSATASPNLGGYNGGGASGNYTTLYAGGGGGATDVRITNGVWNNATSLNSRIMVAGGGGGAGNNTGYTLIGGAGGRLLGGSGNSTSTTYNATEYIPTGGWQTEGGTNPHFGSSSTGQFGYANQSSISNSYGSGGGGGYYGGAEGFGNGGSGGSSFISGFAGVNAITSASNRTHTNDTLHYSNKFFLRGTMKSGNNAGNGRAKIRKTSLPTRTNIDLENVRYIKDCINGNSFNNYDHWVELQAIKDGVNIAYGKTTTIDSGTLSNSSYITDGDINSSNYADGGTGAKCVTLDLENTYNLDEVAIWHYFTGGRTYNDNVTYTSSNGTTYRPIINNTEAETSYSKRVNAWNTPLITYTVNLTSSNANCTVSETKVANYSEVINIPNPTCTGYNFTGWTATSGLNSSTAVYGTTSTPTTPWVNGNTGTYFNNLTDVDNGTVNLRAGFTIKTYNVQLVVNHGSGSTTKTVNHGSTTTFTISPDTNYVNPTVSCTNSQTATISGNTVTTGSITNNTVCTVTYVPNTVAVTVTGYPSSTVKIDGTSYSLNSSGNVNVSLTPGSHTFVDGYISSNSKTVNVTSSTSSIIIGKKLTSGTSTSLPNGTFTKVKVVGSVTVTQKRSSGSWAEPCPTGDATMTAKISGSRTANLATKTASLGYVTNGCGLPRSSSASMDTTASITSLSGGSSVAVTVSCSTSSSQGGGNTYVSTSGSCSLSNIYIY